MTAPVHEHVLDQLHEAIQVFSTRDGGAVPGVSLTSRLGLGGHLGGRESAKN